MKLQDYIHYYIGCKILFDNKEWQIFRIEVTGKGILVTGNRFFATGGWRHNTIWATECNLILRRLEDMTEEEAEKLAIIYSGAKSVKRTKGMASNWHYFFCYFGEETEGEVLTISADGCAWYAHYFDKSQPGHRNVVNEHFATHYLLKQQFDLFGLIDVGMAIDAKTLQP